MLITLPHYLTTSFLLLYCIKLINKSHFFKYLHKAIISLCWYFLFTILQSSTSTTYISPYHCYLAICTSLPGHLTYQENKVKAVEKVEHLILHTKIYTIHFNVRVLTKNRIYFSEYGL